MKRKKEKREIKYIMKKENCMLFLTTLFVNFMLRKNEREKKTEREKKRKRRQERR